MSSELPEGWRSVTLSDVAEINPEALRASTPTDFSFGYIDISQIDSPGQCAGWVMQTFADAPSRARRKVRAGDALVSTVRPYLRSFAQVPDARLPLVASTGFAVVRARAEADQQFLYQHILHSSFINHLSPRMTGTNYPAVSASDVGAYPFKLPPFDEQRRIAEVLSSIDDATLLATQTSRAARATFDRLIDELHSRNAHNVVPLRELCVPKGLQTGPFGSQLKVADYVANGIPVLMPTDLTPDGINFSSAKATSRDKAGQLTQHRLYPGDILFSRRGDVEKCGLYLDGDPPALCGTGCLRARIDPQKADPVLIYFLAQSSRSGQWLRQHAVGITMPNLNTSIVGALPIPHLKLDEQREWVEALLLAEGTCRINETNAAHLASAKLAISSDLLSGRLRVPAPISADTKSVQPAFKRAVFAAEIVDQLRDGPRFGSVKHEKIVHLCELHLGLQDDLDRHAYKEAAGPYDPKARRSVEGIFRQQKWFNATKRDGRVVYEPLEARGGHARYFERYFGDRKDEIQEVIDLLRPMTTQQCEIVATLYAVWNDFLIDGRQPTDDEIVRSVLTDWSESKQQIEEQKWHAALPWMRKKGLIPKGRGEKTRVAMK